MTKPSTAIKGTSSGEAGSLHCVGAKCLLQGGTGICCMIYVGCLLPSSCDFLLLHQNYNGRRSTELATLHAFLSLCHPSGVKMHLQFHAWIQHQAEFLCSGPGNTGNPSTKTAPATSCSQQGKHSAVWDHSQKHQEGCREYFPLTASFSCSHIR